MPDLPIIEHEILGILYHYTTMTIVGTGTPANGQNPLFAEADSLPLHYGAIWALLNNPDKFKSKDISNLNYYLD
jgi:hypothetical protein